MPRRPGPFSAVSATTSSRESPIVVDVADRPGGLAEVAERLGAAGVNILGALTIGRRPGLAEMAFVVDDVERARTVLAATEIAQG
ncbi:MAG: hypothetical protein KatS3mg065_1090 [Chloroflexota bacterium]|nr:MAG: hypothetical protein KatS3mg065_1090 [Chloroflexota bacterium]